MRAGEGGLNCIRCRLLHGACLCAPPPCPVLVVGLTGRSRLHPSDLDQSRTICTSNRASDESPQRVETYGSCHGRCRGRARARSAPPAGSGETSSPAAGFISDARAPLAAEAGVARERCRNATTACAPSLSPLLPRLRWSLHRGKRVSVSRPSSPHFAHQRALRGACLPSPHRLSRLARFPLVPVRCEAASSYATWTPPPFPFRVAPLVRQAPRPHRDLLLGFCLGSSCDRATASA